MGCCASTEEVQTIADAPVTHVEAGTTEQEEVKERLNIAEAGETKVKPGNETFIGSVLKARAEHADDAELMKDCCTRLQALNVKLKEYVAIYDCQTLNEAMHDGIFGLGSDDEKLIAALCTRTKSQLGRTRKKYRDLYDKDLRKEVKGETGSGSYGRMMYFALAGRAEYVADIIDMACEGWGCDEVALLEVFVTHTQAELQAGKTKWEDRTDKHLIDYLKGELDGWIGNGYKHLRRLLCLLYMGDRVETDEVDEELAAQQVDTLQEECEKGWFEDFDESLIIEIIGKNTTNQNQLVAQLFEKKYEASLAKSLKGKCGDKLFYALNALLMTKSDFVAMRLHDAMKGWFTNKDILTRLLGGLDGDKMAGVAEAFERKYDQPLWSALKAEISGNFLSAALVWLNSIDNDPARGAEKFTEQTVDDLGDDAPKLAEMLDYLFIENEAVLCFVAFLDVEAIREATKGWGTDDTKLIRAFATRNKRALARVNIGYRGKYGEPLQALIEAEMGDKGWYPYLAKFLVVQAEQADLMILDLAMDGPAVDHAALVEFLCARHPKRVRTAKAKWENYHDDSLVDKLSDTLTGDMARLAFKMLKGKRDVDDDKVDEGLARKQAHQLHDGAIDYIDTLCMNSSEQNALVGKYYEEAYDTSLRRAISQEYSGPVKNALLALLQGPSEWYAAQLKGAFSGNEVNEKVICRILGAHDKDEIKKIAASYEKKYNVPLKSMLSDKCEGQYKRLAVAWVDLPDQLAQPDKKIHIPTSNEMADDSKVAQKASETNLDNEISEDDDDMGDDVDPTSPLFKAKLLSWRRKYQKYNEMGKVRKAEHYQRLLLLNPPLPKGNKILKGFAEALEEEYKKDATGDDWTGMWLDTVDESEFEAAGTSKDFFKEWFDVTESMVADKKVTVKEMKAHWGLNEAPVAQARTYEPAPLAGYAAAPVYPQAQPAYPQAQPVYPQAAPVMMQPPVYQQPYAPAPPIYGGGPPLYQPQVQSYTTTTTTTSQSTYGQPMMMTYGQPQMMQPQMVVYR